MEIGVTGLLRCDVNVSTAEAMKSDRGCDCVPEDSVTHTMKDSPSSNHSNARLPIKEFF